MKKTITLIWFLVIASSAEAKIYDVVMLGADSKGLNKCTSIIDHAITRAASDGGGTIYFPAGKYLTGPIHLKSNITIELEAGAIVKFSDDFEDFLPFVKVRYEGIFMKTFSPLIYAVGAENISIKGEGEIDGNGFKWWEVIKSITSEVRENGRVAYPDKYQQLWLRENESLKVEPYYQKTLENNFFRPPLIQFQECSNINIDGISIRNSPFWTINPVGCDDVTVHRVKIFNPEYGRNTDGINPSSCSNVRISDCFISVGDDCVTIKSGRDGEGREYGRPCENITVTNCIMLAGHGGVVIGSEMSGGVKNVAISNCVFNGTDNGIRLKSARGRGGVVENIRVNNILMRNIKSNAFIFNLFYDQDTLTEPVSERTPIFRNIHISNITGTDVNKIGFINGLKEMPVEELSFININISAREGFLAKEAKNIHFNNIDFAVMKGPSLSLSDCHTIILDNVRSSSPVKNQAILEIESSSQVLINNCCQMVPADVFSQITKSDIIWGNNFFKSCVQQKICNKL
ncbi:MAG: glycoside hydrolase family 28 protein [Mangrovibacterium sp.]